MKLKYSEVTQANKHQVMSLSVMPEQMGNIETVKACLLEAEQLSLWKPLVICDGETMVGFAMYGLFEEEGTDGRVWLDRLMIDQHYQGRGYAHQALIDLKTLLIKTYQRSEIYLSVMDDTIPAVRLYKKHGFVFNGETDEKGEKLMVFSNQELLRTLQEKTL
jgi:diamine N-acetyltransferase